MSGLQASILGLVVLIQLICSIGVLIVDDPFDRLHLIGPVSVFGSILVTVAVVVGGTSTTHLAKVVVTGALLWGASPFLTRATARALRIRAVGDLEVGTDELIEDDRG